tara:strand:+ start:45 stop:845 length:801 start_codon:yes stop_codon:yes gene_type:complete
MELLFTFLLLSSVCFGQSKKEQIEGLNSTIDSLNTVLATTRDNSTTDISLLNNKIKEITDDVTAVQSSNNKLTKENDKLKTGLLELSQEILNLESEITSKNINIGSCWQNFNLDSISENFLNAFLLLTTAKWEEVDYHYFDHYGAKKYSMDDSRYSLITDFYGEGGSSGETLYLMSGDNIILCFQSSIQCEDYIDGKHSVNDLTSYSIVYFINQEVSFIYGEEKMECGDSGYHYKKSNENIEYAIMKKNVERIHQFIMRKQTDYEE